MKHHIKTALTIFTCLMASISLFERPYQAASGVLSDDQKAISLVRTALALIVSAKPKSASIHAAGKWLWSNEGLSPEQPTRTMRLNADWEVDFQNKRFLQRSAGYLNREMIWCSQIMLAREITYSLLEYNFNLY